MSNPLDSLKYRIVKIQKDKSIINPPEDFVLKNYISRLQFQAGAKTIVNSELNLVSVFFMYTLLYVTDPNADVENITDSDLSTINELYCKNEFNVEGLTNILAENNGSLPESLLVYFISISIQHARGMHAEEIQGTRLEDTYIPIISPTMIKEDLLEKVEYIDV